MRIVCISDVHGKWNKIKDIPECDLLISAGDYSFRGEEHMVRDFHKWLDKQPAQSIISVQGNHETGVEKNFDLMKKVAQEVCPAVHFIDEGLIEIDGYKIWCSAITRFFCNWAWNRYPGEDIQKHWDRIPMDADIIISHGPCYGILDSVPIFDGQQNKLIQKHLGCPQLLEKVLAVAPELFVCGHIHPSRGYVNQNGIRFVNASICDDNYHPVNQPIIIEL